MPDVRSGARNRKRAADDYMIPVWSYTDAYERDRERVLAVADRVFSSGRLILGREVETFERSFASYCGVQHGIGVNSGTDALFLALKALGIGTGDEVVTVANTAVPTVAAIRAAGAMPVFADVEEDTFLIDVGAIERVLSVRTRCILPVHLFGQMADMEAIMSIAARRGLHVIEDCAQAAGALYDGKRAGSLGDIGAFSFYPTKVLGGYGDGGMAVTTNEALGRKLRRLRFYGMDREYVSEEEGYNSRLDELQAALLHDKLPLLAAAVARRREIAARYDNGLGGVGDLRLPVVRSGRTHQFYTYTVRSGKRDRLAEHLRKNGIETKVNYPVPIHLMPAYAGLGTGGLPVTERLAGEILSLPMYPGLSDDAIDRVIESVRAFYA